MRQSFLFEDHHSEIDARVKAHGRDVLEPLEAQWLDEDRHSALPTRSWVEEEDARSRQILEGLKASGLLRFAVSMDGSLDGGAACLCREGLAYHSRLADFVYALPGLSNLWMILLKATPLLFLLGIEDVVYWARELGGAKTSRFAYPHPDWRLGYFLALLVFYLFLTWISEKVFDRLKLRFGAGVAA